MSLEQDRYNTELKQRIEKQSYVVKHMTDSELMGIYEKMHDNPDQQDAALLVACYREVNRRYIASGWIWKRCVNRNEYNKWKNFMERIEAKATRFALDIIQKTKNDNIKEG